MINREQKQVIYRAFSNTKDKYGQLKRESTDQEVDMVIKIMGQSNVEDPRFIDCDSLGITRERGLKPGNYIVDGEVSYLIKYVIPSFRYQQVFLKCEK